MSVALSNVEYMWQSVILPRQGDVYVFGGSLDSGNTSIGTDCSGAVSGVNDGLLFGPNMTWGRKFWTGTFAGANPGDRGPFGGVAPTANWVCIPAPDRQPPGAVMTVAVLQLSDPSQAHMVCAVLDPTNITGFNPTRDPGLYIGIESGGSFTDNNGNSTLHIGPLATGVDDSEFNQWFALDETIGDAPPPPPLSHADQYALTIIATGQKLGITPMGIQIAFAVVFVECNWSLDANPNDPDSMNFPHDGVGTDGTSVGLFQQQNVGWGPLSCRMDVACSATTFFGALQKLNYNDPRQTPGWYAWHVQQPLAADRGRYDQRFNEAVALYNRLINTPVSGDDMAAVPQAEWDAVRDKVLGPPGGWASRSRLREPDPAPGQPFFDDTVGRILSTDGNSHESKVIAAAENGDSESIALLQRIATMDVATHPDRPNDPAFARNILTKLATPTPAPFAPAPFTPAPVPFPVNPTPVPLAPVVIPPLPAGLPTVDATVLEALLLLQRFNNQLPPDFAKAINLVVEIVKIMTGPV